MKLYHSCVLTTLLYGSECWHLTEKDLAKLFTFHTKSLWRILCIFWPHVISNEDLFKQCGTEPMATILIRRRWRWIGHVTCQDASIAKTALRWMPEGKRKRGCPMITWRQSVEKQIKEMEKTWGGITSLWQGTSRCEGSMLLPYTPLRRKGHEWVSERVSEFPSTLICD